MDRLTEKYSITEVGEHDDFLFCICRVHQNENYTETFQNEEVQKSGLGKFGSVAPNDLSPEEEARDIQQVFVDS